jgi:hypothetical protein
LAVKTVFLAEPELSAELVSLVGDLNDVIKFATAFDEVVSGPGVVDGMEMCKLSVPAIAADTTLAGACVENPLIDDVKVDMKSPFNGILRFLAAAMTASGGDDDTANSVDVDFNDKW